MNHHLEGASCVRCRRLKLECTFKSRNRGRKRGCSTAPSSELGPASESQSRGEGQGEKPSVSQETAALSEKVPKARKERAKQAEARSSEAKRPAQQVRSRARPRAGAAAGFGGGVDTDDWGIVRGVLALGEKDECSKSLPGAFPVEMLVEMALCAQRRRDCGLLGKVMTL